MARGCALGGERHQHVAVDHAAHLLLGEGAGEIAERLESAGEARAVAILARGQYGADLKKRARVEGAVLQKLEELGVPGVERRCGSKGDRFAGGAAVLGGIVTGLDDGLRHDGDGVALADVGFLEGVVIDAVDLHVFVAEGVAAGEAGADGL